MSNDEATRKAAAQAAARQQVDNLMNLDPMDFSGIPPMQSTPLTEPTNQKQR